MASARLSEGAVLAERYEIQEVVGRGGMGTVYRALDRRIDATVAIKELAEQPGEEEEQESYAKQFEREAKLLASLRHQNLPRVTDYFVEGGRCYLVMEFIQGETLDSILRHDPGYPVPLTRALDWGVQISDVLCYLHAQNPPVIFRDLKPANVMLTPDGVAKLIDFGIARRFQDGAGKDTLLYGSPGYSPPEQYGRAQTDARSDIYALGATLHHLVTGDDPSATPFKFATAGSSNPSIPPALNSLISDCVLMDPDKRPRQAETVRDALIQIRAAVKSAPGTHSPALANESPRIISKKADDLRRTGIRRRILALVGVAVAVIVAAVFGFRAFKGHGTQPAGPPSAAERTRQTSGTANTRSGNEAGKLRVTSTPEDAEVFLDGKELGKTPFDAGSVPSGKHTLKLIPPANSGLHEWTQDIEVAAGESRVVDVQLASAAGGNQKPAAEPGVTLQSVGIQAVPNGTPEVPEEAIRFHIGLRIAGAAGRTVSVAVHFHSTDGITPLKPRITGTPYQTAEGQLSVSAAITADSDPADIQDLTLLIPTSVFPVSLDQASFRIVAAIDGKQVLLSDPSPLRINP